MPVAPAAGNIVILKFKILSVPVAIGIAESGMAEKTAWPQQHCPDNIARRNTTTFIIFSLYFSVILRIKVYHPFNTKFVSEHSKVGPPWTVVNGHFNISTCR